MKKNDWKDRLNVVYSTNPDFGYEMDNDEEQVTLDKDKQNLRVSIDKKNRGGKVVTLITGFVGTENDLKELGKLQTPVLLKRGLANTIEEFLMSAEYIMAGGNENVVLCERGIRTFETSMRNTLDISAVPMLKSKTHLPVVIDPSHAAGIAWMVEPLAMAAIAAGADGLIVEVHPNPKVARSDAAQQLTIPAYAALARQAAAVAAAVGREL